MNQKGIFAAFSALALMGSANAWVLADYDCEVGRGDGKGKPIIRYMNVFKDEKTTVCELQSKETIQVAYDDSYALPQDRPYLLNLTQQALDDISALATVDFKLIDLKTFFINPDKDRPLLIEGGSSGIQPSAPIRAQASPAVLANLKPQFTQADYLQAAGLEAGGLKAQRFDQVYFSWETMTLYPENPSGGVARIGTTFFDPPRLSAHARINRENTLGFFSKMRSAEFFEFDDKTEAAFSLVSQTTVIHEILHTMGFDHAAPHDRSVMGNDQNNTIRHTEGVFMTLSDSDAEGLRVVYGERPELALFRDELLPWFEAQYPGLLRPGATMSGHAMDIRIQPVFRRGGVSGSTQFWRFYGASINAVALNKDNKVVYLFVNDKQRLQVLDVGSLQGWLDLKRKTHPAVAVPPKTAQRVAAPALRSAPLLQGRGAPAHEHEAGVVCHGVH